MSWFSKALQYGYFCYIFSIKHIYRTWCSDEIGSKIKCRSMFYDVLMVILMEGLKKEYNKKHSEIYKRILYLENNYLSDISVAEPERMSGMCETGFITF